MYARPILLLVLLLTLSDCASDADLSANPNASSLAGSELARPTARQAGVTGR